MGAINRFWFLCFRESHATNVNAFSVAAATRLGLQRIHGHIHPQSLLVLYKYMLY